MSYTHIVTIANLAAAMSSSLPTSSPLDPTVSLLSLPRRRHCLPCLRCCRPTDGASDKWWHCGLTRHTCRTDGGYAPLVQPLTPCPPVVILEVLGHPLVVSVPSSAVHKALG